MKNKNDRQMVRDTFYKISPWVGLEVLVDDLNNLFEDAEIKGWTKLGTDLESGYDGMEMVITGLRPETDSEYQSRVEANKRLQDTLAEKELKELKRLQKIYGDKV